MKKNKIVIVGLLCVTMTSFNCFSCGIVDSPVDEQIGHIANTPTLASIRFNAASVMPVVWRHAPHQLPRLYVLLSREVGGKDKGTYDDWGGSRDKGDHHPRTTASREFLEEAIAAKTIGMSSRLVNNYINVSGGKTFFVVVQEKVGGRSTMVTYLTLFEPEKIKNILSKFHTERGKVRSWKYKEKDRLALISWDNLAQALHNAKYAKNIKVNAEVLDPSDGLLKEKKVTLRPAFVSKLRSFFKGDNPYASAEEGKVLFFRRNIAPVSSEYPVQKDSSASIHEHSLEDEA